MARASDQEESAFHARIVQNLDLCDIVASQLIASLALPIPRDELIAIGREALTIASKSFDETLGVPFRRYASVRVRGGLIDAVRQRGNLPRRVYSALRALESADAVQEAMIDDDAGKPPPSPEQADAKVGQYLNDAAVAMALSFLTILPMTAEAEKVADQSASQEEALDRARLLGRLQGAMKGLPEKELDLVKRHYFAGKSLVDAGREMGLSRSWACRLHARAIELIAAKLVDIE